MANRKITELNALTAPAASDVLPIVDISETSNALKNKKITYEDLLSNAPNGTAAAPSISFNSDSDTGVFRPGANQFAIATGGTQRVHVDSSGNVGIGTDAPLEKFHINAGSSGVTSAIGGVDGAVISTGAGRTGGLIFFTPNDRSAGIFFGDPEDNNSASYRYDHASNATIISSNNAERLRIDSSGNVGIGTSSPTQLIDLESTSGGRIAFTDTGTRRYSVGNYGTGASSFTIRDDSASAERLVITNEGRVGIGTISPSGDLHVKGSATGTDITIEGNASTDYTFLRIVNPSGAEGQLAANADVGVQLRSVGSYPLQFMPNGNEQMRIAANGYVGIGTTNPSEKLHVSGNILSSICKTIGSYTNLTPLQLDRGVSGSGMHVNLTSGRYELEATDKPLVFNAGYSTGAIEFNINGSQKMRIINNGNVGINTSSPSKTLHVEGSSLFKSTTTNGTVNLVSTQNLSDAGLKIAFFGANRFETDEEMAYIQPLLVTNGGGAGNVQEGHLAFGTSGSERLRISAGGNVGIGATGPTELLQLQAADNPKIRFVDQGNYEYKLGITSNNKFSLLRSGSDTETVTIDSGGNVGIGTSNPGAKLDVAGAAKVDDNLTLSRSAVAPSFVFENSNYSGSAGAIKYFDTGSMIMETDGSEKFRVTSGGNVGIGTASPGSLLHINKSTNNFIKLSTGTSAVSTEQGLLNYGRFISGTTPAFPGQLTSYIKEIRNGSSAQFSLHFGTTDSNTADATNKMIVRYDGNVGIGNDSPITKLQVGNFSGQQELTIGSGTGSKGSLLFGDGASGSDYYRGQVSYDHSDDSMRFYTGVTERVRIASNGHVYVGTTSNFVGVNNTDTGFHLEKASDGCTAFISRANGQTLHLNRNSNGQLQTFRRSKVQVGSVSVTTTATTYNTTSDYRLKENVVELDGAIARINQLQPRRFNFIAEPGTTVDGFLAHEAQAVVPEAVTGTHNEVDDDGEPVMQGIDHSRLVPLLTAALQEALAKIETLETKVAALEASN